MTAKNKWPTTRLGDLAEFRNGVNYDKRSFGEGVKVVGVADFQDYTKPLYGELKEINPKGIVTERNILRDGDIVFVRSNGNRQLIGRSLFIEEPPEEITHSAFTIRLRFASPKVQPKFYAYCFRTPLIRQALSAYGGGTNINNLNQDILNALEVPLPPLSVQRRIADILSTYDELIENNTQRIKILEEMARALYREWFVHFRFPGHEKIKYVDSLLGKIPDGWNLRRVKDVVLRLKAGRSYTGSEVSETATVPIIDQSRDELLGFHDNPPDHVATDENPIIVFGDHTCKMEMMTMPFSVGPNVVPFTSRDELTLAYLFFLVRELVQTREYKRHWTDLMNKRVTTAPQSLAKEFSSVVIPFFRQIDLLRRKSANLRRTRDLLLPRLISGEIDL